MNTTTFYKRRPIVPSISNQSFKLSNIIFKMSATDAGFIAALEEAKKGANEGGVPIGACLVSADGKILGRGHNMRMQKDSPTIHVR